MKLMLWPGAVIPGWHQHGVSVTHDGDELRFVGFRINHLNSERGRRHVEIDVELLEQGGVLVRWPARPIAGKRAREAEQDAPRLDVVADDDVEIT